jgi:hypothetical protein
VLGATSYSETPYSTPTMLCRCSTVYGQIYKRYAQLGPAKGDACRKSPQQQQHPQLGQQSQQHSAAAQLSHVARPCIVDL